MDEQVAVCAGIRDFNGGDVVVSCGITSQGVLFAGTKRRS